MTSFTAVTYNLCFCPLRSEYTNHSPPRAANDLRALIQAAHTVDSGRNPGDRTAALLGHKVEDAGIAECISRHRCCGWIGPRLHHRTAIACHLSEDSAMLSMHGLL